MQQGRPRLRWSTAVPRLAGMRQPRSSLSSSPLIESSNIVRILRKLSDWSAKAAPRHGSAGITCSSATACNGLWDKVLRAFGCLSTPGIAARGSTCVCLLVPQPGRAGRRLRLCMAGPYVATKYISGFQFKVDRIQILPTCTWSRSYRAREKSHHNVANSVRDLRSDSEICSIGEICSIWSLELPGLPTSDEIRFQSIQHAHVLTKSTKHLHLQVLE